MRENMHTDRWGRNTVQECQAKDSRKETKIQEFMFRDTTNVVHEMCDYTGNNWGHRNSNRSFPEKCGGYTRRIS
jgi:hypothetical protein